MPRAVTAFACEFRCGRRTTMNRKSAIEHEARCFHNPATRSCQTCRHDVEEDHGIGDGDNIPEFARWASSMMVKVCAVDARENANAKTNCDKWESRARNSP